MYIEKNVEFLRHPENIIIGDDVLIKEGVKLCPTNNKASIKIGSNVTIGYYTMIFASNNINIGQDCLIAPFVYLVDSDHESKKNMLINKQPLKASPINIGEDVWISTGAKILSGVEIGNGAIIAAGSVVTQNVEEFTIYGGIPAKKIGMRE